MNRTLPPRRHFELVRRRSLFQRILAYPADLFLSVMEVYHTLPWDRLFVVISWPLGAFFNVLSYIATSRSPVACNIAKVLTTSSYKQHQKIIAVIKQCGGDHFVLLKLALAAISILNAVLLFRSSRQYRFYHVDPLNLPSSKNIKYVLSRPPSIWQKIKREIWYRLPWRKDDDSDQGSVDSESEPADLSEKVAELGLWEMSKFYRNIFCLFSPVQWVLLNFSADDNTKLFLAVAIPVMLLYIFNAFTEYKKDRELVFQHVLYEYNKTLINPLVAEIHAERKRKRFMAESSARRPSQDKRGSMFKTHDNTNDQDDHSNVRWANTQNTSHSSPSGCIVRPCDDCQTRRISIRQSEGARSSFSNLYNDKHDNNIFQGLSRRRHSKD